MSRHPNRELLALHTGGDLPVWRRLYVNHHLYRCEECRAEEAMFRASANALCEAVPRLNASINWEDLAAEMRANIRLGLEASEAIAAYDSPAPSRSQAGKWTGVLVAAMVMILFAGAWWFGVRSRKLQTPVMMVHQPAVVAATGAGVEVLDGGLAMELRTPASRDAFVTVSTQGTAQTRYTDAETGQITVNHVYMD